MAILVCVAYGLGVATGQGRLGFGTALTRISDSQQETEATEGLPDDLNYASVEQAYDILKKRYDGKLEEHVLIDGLKQGLALATGDPYTEYLNAEAAEQFNDDLNGTFTGIGAELSAEENFIIVVSPIEGFPAEKAGLRPKDIITKIDGETAINLSISDAVKRIRGPKGEKVTLTIVRDESEELEIEIVRDEIKIASVKHEILENNIGLLKISRFAEDTVRLASKAAQEFIDKDVKGVILDLRGNPGGLLQASVDVSGLWLEPGKTVVVEKRGEVVIKTFEANGKPLLNGLKTVVLINEGSASASEIVAGALKDHEVAQLIGEKSFGKGSVQSLEKLLNNSLLKVTIARWFTPNGNNIDKEGVKPDKTVERTNDDYKNKLDPQLDAAKAEF